MKLKATILSFIGGLLFRLFLIIGTRLFRIISIYRGGLNSEGSENLCLHFATDERTLNCSVRDFVESLDARTPTTNP